MPVDLVSLSVSTWRQPTPPPPTAERAAVLDRLIEMIDSLGDHRLRVAIDGLTAGGKTSLGHELAYGLAGRGRHALRASLDDFKRPWRERHLYDRESGEGYYRNAFDPEAARRLLLEPSGQTADGLVALCSIDPLTQIDHSEVTTAMAPDGVHRRRDVRLPARDQLFLGPPDVGRDRHRAVRPARYGT